MVSILICIWKILVKLPSTVKNIVANNKKYYNNSNNGNNRHNYNSKINNKVYNKFLNVKKFFKEFSFRGILLTLIKVFCKIYIKKNEC